LSLFVHSIHRPINELYVGIQYDEQTNREKRKRKRRTTTKQNTNLREKNIRWDAIFGKIFKRNRKKEEDIQ